MDWRKRRSVGRIIADVFWFRSKEIKTDVGTKSKETWIKIVDFRLQQIDDLQNLAKGVAEYTPGHGQLVLNSLKDMARRILRDMDRETIRPSESDELKTKKSVDR